MSGIDEDVNDMMRLVYQLGWTSQRRLARQLEQHSLTLAQFSALRAIQRCPEQCCTMTELADHVHQVLPTMTGIIRRLIEREFVRRWRDPTDRRSLRVSLTTKGKEVLNEIDRQNEERLRQVFHRFSTEERRAFRLLMNAYLETTQSELEKHES